MKVRDASDIYDNRPLIVKASELKNTQTGFEPPFTLGKPKEGTKEGRKVLAMDAAISNVLSGFKDELSYIAMPKFVGYPMLANISQEALIRAGVETIADEMTRKFVEYTYDDDDGEDSEKKDDLITKMEAQAAKYKLVETANKAFVMDGLFGGCLIYIDMGNLTDEEKEEPLIFDKKTFKKGSFRGFKVIEPINCYPGWYNTTDPTSFEYFKPKYWYILGKKYHASRFIYIALNEAPLLLKPAYNFFGIPRAQLALDYVAQFVANRESAQELLNKFSLTCWKTNMAQVLQGASTSDLVKRAKLFNRMKHNSGVMLLDKESEDMVQLNTPLGGVRDIVEMSLNLLTAVWRIPKIKYLGEGEGGLNASSKEQMRSFYDFILSQKEKGVTQMMETVLKIFQLNLGLDINKALGFRFPSLVEMDEADRASLNKMQADRDNIYLTNGVLSQEEVRQRLSMDKNSGYSMIDTDEVPEIPEEPLKDDKEAVNNEVDRQTAEDSDLVEDDDIKIEKPITFERIKGFFVNGFKSSHQKDLINDSVDKDGREHSPLNGRFCEKGTNFKYEINKLFEGKYNGPNEIEVVSSLSSIWTNIGVQNKGVFFHKDKILRVSKEHGIKIKDFENLPNNLCNPKFIFKSKTDSRAFVAILEETTSPLIAVLLPLDDENNARNIIKSFYWKDENFIERETKANRLLYKKSEIVKDDTSFVESHSISDKNINEKYYLYLFKDI